MGKPKIILISGPSAAGKTTVAEQLKASSANFEHIRQDDYLKDPATFAWQGQYQIWDDPNNLKFDLLIGHLQSLLACRQVAWHTFAKQGEQVYEYALEPRPYILVEGNFVLTSAELKKMADKIFYIDVPLDVSLSRRYERGKRWGLDLQEYDQVMMVPSYHRWSHLKDQADFILDGRQPTEKLVKAILDFLN